MDEKRIKRVEALESKINEFLTAKALLQRELRRIDKRIMHMVEERHKIIQFDTWAHHYSENVLISKMDLYDDIARHYWNLMDYYKSNKLPKTSKQYQTAKIKYRTAIVNLESVIDRINWIDSKFYRKEF